jgi:hypothetical protein
MGFLKSVLKVAAAPLTIPAKVASNVVGSVSNATGLGSVPILGDVLHGASSVLSLADDARTGKDTSEGLKEAGKAALVAGAAIATGGIAVPALIGASEYGGGSLLGGAKNNPGLAAALESGLGIPAGTLESFLPSSSKAPTQFSGGDSGGGGYVPTTQSVDYGVPQSGGGLFPILMIGGLGLAAVLVLKKKGK